MAECLTGSEIMVSITECENNQEELTQERALILKRLTKLEETTVINQVCD